MTISLYISVYLSKLVCLEFPRHGSEMWTNVITAYEKFKYIRANLLTRLIKYEQLRDLPKLS